MNNKFKINDIMFDNLHSVYVRIIDVKFKNEDSSYIYLVETMYERKRFDLDEIYITRLSYILYKRGQIVYDVLKGSVMIIVEPFYRTDNEENINGIAYKVYSHTGGFDIVDEEDLIDPMTIKPRTLRNLMFDIQDTLLESSCNRKTDVRVLSKKIIKETYNLNKNTL